jgi:predicted transcriptional regulator
LILSEYGELNQTKLLSYCGLNIVKHKEILDSMEKKELLEKKVEPWGKKSIIKYKVSPKGHEFFKLILEPYEEMFPRVDGDE